MDGSSSPQIDMIGSIVEEENCHGLFFRTWPSQPLSTITDALDGLAT